MKQPFLVITPLHLPWERLADYQRQTCLELAKKHLVVVYVNDDARFFLKPRPARTPPHLRNIVFYQPRYLIPLRRYERVERANQFLNVAYLLWRYGREKKAIIWIFDPHFWFFPFARRIYPRVVSLYDCVDYHAGYLTGGLARVLKHMEKKLISNVDYFVVNSQSLFHLHAPTRRPDAIVPLGFALDSFRKDVRRDYATQNKKPIVGYVGTLDNRVDFVLLESLVSRHNDWRFVLWGKISDGIEGADKLMSFVARLKTYPNVSTDQSNDRFRVAQIIGSFDIGIIPYKMRHKGVTYSYPMKVMEYFYTGIPVVSTPIEELKRYSGLIMIAKTTDDWEAAIRKLLLEAWPSSKKRLQRTIALKNSWEKKTQTILSVISPDADGHRRIQQ